MKNPYLHKGKTVMKVRLPTSRKNVWKLFATPKGIAAWFPPRCTGTVAEGKSISFHWGGNRTDKFIISKIVKDKMLETSWFLGGKVRYTLAGGSPTTLTLEVTYPGKPKGSEDQLIELSGWTFFLLNLKSRIMSGADLRHKSNQTVQDAYID